MAQGGGGQPEQLQAAGMDFLPMVVTAEEQSWACSESAPSFEI